MSDIEYVIYCRKSTDESSGMQVQSIPDQIRACKEYAERNWLKIKAKPKDFDFETPSEVAKEDAINNIEDKRIYQWARDKFVIREQKSWKIPGKREKRNKLMKLIDKWKVQWLLSYSPDRQSRNMLEWWVLINFVDEWKIDLKYTNFHFENTASWKMMLWVWFVFSKQYADAISENVTRWNRSTVRRWKSLWAYKYWYTINEDWYYVPDEELFPLMKQAFQKKIYGKMSDKSIANRLNANWFKRKKKKQWDLPINYKQLSPVWKDTFYYWMFVSWAEIVDLRERNPYYQPMITEEEYERLNASYKKQSVQKIKDEYESISPIPQWLLISKSWAIMSRYLPNPWRFKKKLEELKKTNPNADYWDFVKPNQIRYKVWNKKAETDGIEITYDIIDKQVEKALAWLKIDKDAYNSFVEYQNNQLQEENERNNEQRNRISVMINKATKKRDDFIRKNMHLEKDEEEERVYEQTKKAYDDEIKAYHEEFEKIEIVERNTIVEFELFIEMLQKADKYYKKANYVQKAKILEILFSNIILDEKKGLTIKVKPWLECIFDSKFLSGTPGQEYFEQLYDFIGKSNIISISSFMQRRTNETAKKNEIQNALTEKQRVLYWFTEDNDGLSDFLFK